MDFVGSIRNSIRIIRLDEEVISKVSDNSDSTNAALLIAAIGGVAGSIGVLNPVGIFFLPIFAVAALAIGTGVLHIIARILGGKGEYSKLFRVLGHVSIIQWVNVIPVVGFLISMLLGLWSIVVSIVVIRTIHNISTFRAVLVIIIPVFVVTGFVLLISLMLGMAIASVIGSNPAFSF
ncbi:MAG: Yip1 family protein [Methanobacteriota archaeon]